MIFVSPPGPNALCKSAFPTSSIASMIPTVASTWYWNPNNRFLNRNAWFLHNLLDERSEFPVGGGGAGGGAGFAGAGSFGKSNVSQCQWNMFTPSEHPYTIGSVPPGNGNVTGAQPISGRGVNGSAGLGASPCFSGGAIFTFG